MANELNVGTSVVGFQMLLRPNRPYPYVEVYSGFGQSLPPLRFQGHLILGNFYEFGSDEIFVALRTISHFSQPSGFLLRPEELALNRIAIAANWQNPGYDWNCFVTDFPYP